ncbi:PIN/TRAM domain-containing protein [Marinilactibacillus sp. Marseille-P9653]|uniref:PIN/TRAM domain-containing protein n=1 Tax=Marinilactibacillus sp. Marseille-P9653 TaxID=2866583 RepID=UPI001CE43A39|nr:PIN/TRAM domain-containing protein [Marinilactibacillus sp. Marseille-P9653]
MITNLIILTLVLVGGSLGYNFFPELMDFIPSVPAWIANPIVGLILGAAIFYLLSFQVIKPIERAIKKIEGFFSTLSVAYVIFGSVGAVIGLILAILISIPLAALNMIFVSNVLPLILAVFFAYIGFQFATSRREEIRRLFTRVQKQEDNGVMERKEGDPFRKYKILDTSTIIDGRILDVTKAGFLEGTFVISQHVLQELQYIADSSDSLKRVRGRRGLDILNALQKEEKIEVQMDDSPLPESDEVDMKLVHLAKKMDGVVVTNDYNLNKVAEFQKVPVLNINELANAVKPVVIPGETMRVMVVKNGTERSQGVAYLDDGTMVVVEEGQHYMNKSVTVVVTSALQTNAGRMIFAKMEHSQKGIDDGKETK